MSNTTHTNTEMELLPEPVQQSQQAWRRLGMQIRAVTPAGLVRFGLVTGALLTIGWLISITWLALLPFVVGAVVAYVLLPLVDWLDRWLPRGLAVTLTMVGMLAALVFFLAQLIPALAHQGMRVYQLSPSVEEVQGYVQQARGYIQALPEPTQNTIHQILEQATVTVRENFDIFISNLVSTLITIVLKLANTFGFILGFFIVPTWLLTILHEQKSGVRAINQLLPIWMYADFWAVLRIFDRTFRAFFQGQVLLALVNGVAIYAGLSLLELLGWPEYEYKLLAAIIIGLLQLIPSIGPFLGAIPAILAMVFQSFFLGASALILYLLIQWLVNMLVLPHIERKIVDIHPAILIVVIVALSELGIWWILFAAPVAVIIRDLFRYTYGRFGSPPRPAGLLPGKPYQSENATQASAAAARVPLAYRHSKTVRRTGS